jgi:hypothetical protein
VLPLISWGSSETVAIRMATSHSFACMQSHFQKVKPFQDKCHPECLPGLKFTLIVKLW